MTGQCPRRLPVRVDPAPGEAVDSWLEAIARRLATPARDLLPALGLDVAAAQGGAVAFAAVLHTDEASRVAVATGVPVSVLQAMTLAHYDAVVHVESVSRRLVSHHAWARRRGSWFCPRCLADSGGRW